MAVPTSYRLRQLLFLASCSLAPLAGWAAESSFSVSEAIEQGYHTNDPAVLARAVETLERQVRAEPHNGELQRALAILLLDRLHDPARAVPYLQKIVEASPDDSSWQQSLARAYRATGQAELAATRYAKAAELQPGDAWVRFELGNTLSGAGHYAEAAEAYRAALAIDSKSTDTRLALAKTLWAAGNTAEATATARAVLDYDPLNASARSLLLSAEKASASPPPTPPAPTPVPVRAAVTLKPMHPADAAVAKAYLSGRSADFEEAAKILEATLRRSPRDLPRRKILAYLYLDKLRRPDEAISHFKKIVEQAPTDSAWWTLLAGAQETAGDLEGAAASYRHAARCAPHDVWSRYHLACTLRRLGRRTEAESAFRDALTVEPKNRYVRRDLARCVYDGGNQKEAASLAHALVQEDPNDAEAHALLGDIQRSQLNFAAAGQEYQAALAAQPANAIARSGIQEIRRKERPELKVAYYTFDDTDHFRQSGIFSYTSVLLTGKLTASASVNERFFAQDPHPHVDRLETGVGFDYRFFTGLQISAGLSQFKTEEHTAKFEGNVAVYYQPVKFADVWVSYRSADPVNDSYFTASTAFSQSVVSAGLNLRPCKTVAFSATGSEARYSDANIRRAALLSGSWYVPLPASPVVRLEYEWLDYEHQTPLYSSPQDYGRLRPVIELSPKITDWLKIELHGELSYVFDEQQWGYGFTAGLRVNKGDAFELGACYMQYEIPGGQTIWSGNGFKVDCVARF